MQSASLQLQNYLAIILTDIALLDVFDEFNGKNRDSVPKLFHEKTVPASAIRACSQIAERSLFYGKTVPASAIRDCYLIAEPNLFYIKTNNFLLFAATSQMTACHTDKPDDNTYKHKNKIHSDKYLMI